MKTKIKEIQKKFNEIVKYSQGISGEINTDKLFEDWQKNKSIYINAWDGELIKEIGEMEFHLSKEQRSHTISNIIDQIEYIYLHSSLRYPDFKFEELTDFILANEDTFFDNIVSHSWKFQDAEIPKGMKILKAFKFFCTDKDVLNDIQSIASMAIQNDKITGVLCMSVHPLDFLSVSENAHNWRSCHSLDGEYRAGNLNYMGDSCTVICYLKSKHKYELPHFPSDIKWNSKKWRMLLFFDEDYQVMMAGRQYPFFENSLLLPIKHEVERMFERRYSGWMDEYYSTDKLKAFLDDDDKDDIYEVSFIEKYLPVGSRLMRMNNLVKNGDGTLQFNDLLNSNSYKNPYYSFALMKETFRKNKFYNIQSWKSTVPKIRVGQACNCVECGNELITLSESFLCKHCMIKEGTATLDYEEFAECPICGSIFDVEDGISVKDEASELFICPDCIKTETKRCEKCGELYIKDILDEDGICPDCKLKKRPLKIVETIESPIRFYNRDTGEEIFRIDPNVLTF